MEGVLPEEFPFSSRRAEQAASAPSSAPVQETGPTTQARQASDDTAAAMAAAVEPRVEHIEVEPLVEVASSGRTVYRGRERRRSPRQALRAKAVYRDDVNVGSSGPVQIVNISMFGVRAWTSRPMQVGDKGSVRLELGPVKWTSMVRVVTVESNDGEGYVIGCEFVAKELPRRRVDAA